MTYAVRIIIIIVIDIVISISNRKVHRK